MFYVHDGVLFDPNDPPPDVFIETTGLVVEHHRVSIRKGLGDADWLVLGGNRPISPTDPGTPDIYSVPRHDKQDGKIVEIFVDVWNTGKKAQKFRLQVLIRQADYEHDVLYDVTDTIPAKDSERHKGYGVFVPIEIMV